MQIQTFLDMTFLKKALLVTGCGYSTGCRLQCKVYYMVQAVGCNATH